MKEKMFTAVLLMFTLLLTCLLVHVSYVRADTYNQIPLWINVLEGVEISRETIDEIESEIDFIFKINDLNWRVTSCILDESMEDPDKTNDNPGDIRIGESDFTGEEGYLWGLGEDETRDVSGFKIFVANKILNETGQDDGTNGIALGGSFRTAIVKNREENETEETGQTWAHEIGHLFGLDHKKQDGTDRSESDLMYPFQGPLPGIHLQPEDVETMKKVKKEQALGLPTTTNLQHNVEYYMWKLSLSDEKEDTEPWPLPDEADLIKIDFASYEENETKEFHITTFFGGVLPREEQGFRYFVTLDTDNNATTGGELDGWLGIDLLIGVDIFGESIIATLYCFPDLVAITSVDARVDTHYKFIDKDTPPEIPPIPIQDSIVINLQQELLGPLSDQINIGALVTTDQGDIIDKLETTPMSTSPPERPNLSLDPPVATSGSTITATGTGFTPNDNISIIFNHATVSVAEVEFDGSFQASLTIPELPVDYYMIDAIDDSHNIGVTMFTLTFGADLNRDETVNILDISIVAMAFGTEPGDEQWNEIADLNNDQIVNVLDISTVAMDFGRTV